MLDMNTLKLQIGSNSYSHKLIFVGEEHYFKKLFIQLLAKSIQGNFHYYNEYNDIEQEIKSNSFFDESQVFIIKNSNFFLKNSKKFLELEVPNNKILILMYDEFEPKKEFFKECNNFICKFDKVGENQLKKIIEKVLTLNANNSSTLCELIDNDCARLTEELKKLVSLKKSLNFLNDDDLFVYAIENEVIHKEIKDNIIDLCESILDTDFHKAFKINASFEKESNDIFKLINRLYDESKRKLLKTGLYIYRVALNFLQRLDRDIKMGKIDNNLAFDYLIINFIKMS